MKEERDDPNLMERALRVKERIDQTDKAELIINSLCSALMKAASATISKFSILRYEAGDDLRDIEERKLRRELMDNFEMLAMLSADDVIEAIKNTSYKAIKEKL